MNNYVFKINTQAENDIEIYQKAFDVARVSHEIVYVSHGIRDLGFVTEKGDVGIPQTKMAYDSTPVR